jgi:hypothetical protein
MSAVESQSPGGKASEDEMNIAELFETYEFRLNWARQALVPYGGDEGPALAIDDGDELRVLVAAPIGIVDLRLSRSGPRSISRYTGSAELWGWGDLGAVGLRSDMHPPQPEFGHGQWLTVVELTIEGLEIRARSDDEPRTRGLADFALEAVRQRSLTCDRDAAASAAGSESS